jgi:antitoxin component YwqK of YwqJK toxin-antitoxin module
VNYKGGKLQGFFRGYLENGKLGSIGRFENGLLQQDHTQVFRGNGQIEYIGGCKAGSEYHGNCDRYGFGKQFSWEGTLKYMGDFVNDNKNGVGHLFHKNSNLKYSGGFKDDAIHSEEVIIYGHHGKVEYIGDAKGGYYNQ